YQTGEDRIIQQIRNRFGTDYWTAAWVRDALGISLTSGKMIRFHHMGIVTKINQPSRNAFSVWALNLEAIDSLVQPVKYPMRTEVTA
ncbi:MAG: hypothetical protein LUQ50_15600, partial [Methanospirillum sp.]|uniref:hypothetical protein n=1 Tax=Methanospirillum sp. TaxID=45200 RepID=UPI00236C1E25